MAKQTLLSFLAAGKLAAGKSKKEEKTQGKEADGGTEPAREAEREAEDNTDAVEEYEQGLEKSALHMVDVEEDIFADIPEKESRKAAEEEALFNEHGKDGSPEADQKEPFGADFFQDIIEPEYETEKEKNIYFEIVLDKTISMTRIYRPIYKKLEKMIDNMARAVKNYQKKGQVGLKWGLTLITEEAPELVRFQESCFTSSSDRMKAALKEFQFEGGSENGRENINGALAAAIGALSRESRGEGRCGLILLTDSLPEEDDMEPDFEFLENVEYTKLCFAHCYVYNCEAYTPYFNMVDGEGETDVKGIHYLEVRDLEAFLNSETNNLTEKLLKKLLHQTSIGG